MYSDSELYSESVRESDGIGSTDWVVDWNIEWEIECNGWYYQLRQ